MNLLVDSCSLIWLASEPDRLSKRAAALIDAHDSVLYVSHATLWEIALKQAAGRLGLPDAPRGWWTAQVERWGLIELPLTAEVLLRGVELPAHHKDPFDRVIVAQAMLHNLVIVSPDEAFSRYGVKVAW